MVAIDRLPAPGTRTSSPSAVEPRLFDRTLTTAELSEWLGHLRNTSRQLREVIREVTGEWHQDISTLHRQTLRREISSRTARRARTGPTELLQELADLGFSWRDLARCVGVSVPAIRKWRQGEPVSGPNRLRLAEFMAVCDLLAENHLVTHVASWFEVPIATDVPVTPLDLYEAGRLDLVLDHGTGHISDPYHVLDDFDPNWRDTYHSDFEVFVAEDGQPSIRLRDSGDR